MSDADGVWRFHVMPSDGGGWKVVEAGKTRSVHVKKGAAMSAATRAYKAHTAKGERAGIVNHVTGGGVRETLYGGPRKTRTASRPTVATGADEAGANQ